MITTNPIRIRKSYSLVGGKQDKQNCNNNIQVPGYQGQCKLIKIRQSLDQYHPPQKLITSLKIQNKIQFDQYQSILKKQYSRLLEIDYSIDIMNTLINRSLNCNQALVNHMITHNLRAKMVDWMIEVLSSYKMSQQCFFRSVKYMDIYFKKTVKKLQTSDLHLIGVVSMFISCKYEQIYPFKLNTIYDKICRKKFIKNQIINLQHQILDVLAFQLQQTTCFDIIKHVLISLHITLQPKTAQYLNKVSIYLGKMAMHCSDLAWRQDKILAAAVIYIALKTVQQVENNLRSDCFLEDIAQITKLKISQLLQMSQELLSLAKTFHKQYPNLGNLKKFNNAEFVQ